MKGIKRVVKQILYLLTGNANRLFVRNRCGRKWYGSDYGGFYVNPDILNEDSIVYSFGIGEDISFDSRVIGSHKCQVFGFDPTPKSIKWVENQTLPAGFHFYPWGIAKHSGPAEFMLPKNPDHVSGSMVALKGVNPSDKIVVEMRSMKDILKQTGHTHIDILKMDIEGAEYDVIEDVLNCGATISQMCVEFHDLMHEGGKRKTREAISLLYKNGYRIFGISQTLCEISFIKDSNNSCKSK